MPVKPTNSKTATAPTPVPAEKPETGGPLDNAAHENFAQGVAEGMSATGAYRAYVAEEGSSTATCMCNSSKLMADPKVKQRVAELRIEFREALENRLGVRRETIARKLVEIVEASPEEIAGIKNSPLVQKLKRKRRVVGRGEDKEEWELEEIETPSKLEALKELNKMAGFHAPEEVKVSGSVAIPGLGEAVTAVFGRK